MDKRGRRTAEELKNVSTADMTPAEYRRSDTPGIYLVELDNARIKVSGLHSARAVSAGRGTIRKDRIAIVNHRKIAMCDRNHLHETLAERP